MLVVSDGVIIKIHDSKKKRFLCIIHFFFKFRIKVIDQG